MELIIACDESNDLYRVLRNSGQACRRFSGPGEALAAGGADAAVMVLADGYPDEPTVMDADALGAALGRGARVYVEFPAVLPGFDVGEPQQVKWTRGVIASDAFEPELERLRIVMIHGCRFVPLAAEAPHVVMARVAGFDRAAFGLPDETHPILFEQERLLVSTTKFSQFVTGRYAPTDAWRAIWRWILTWLRPEDNAPALDWTPTVRPSFGPDERLPEDAERRAAQRGAAWFSGAKLPIHESWKDEAQRRLEAAPQDYPVGPDPDWPVGDGRLGMLEGVSAAIHPNGSQGYRYLLRADCMAEASLALALDGRLNRDERGRELAANLNDFVYFNSELAGGPRADPASETYGLVGWHTRGPSVDIYYGDDNARALLGTIGAAAALAETRWDEHVARCILANLRTTGPLGFRYHSLDEARIQENGWRHFWETERTYFAPHFESWPWACYLWAYRHSGLRALMERTLRGFERMMDAYPDRWHWTNGIQQERARMLLPLAWLVRVEDNGKHREWLRFMAGELLANQAPCGAIREEVGSAGKGRYGPARSNEEYGTTETPLIHENGDPLADMLYTCNFAFLGLHEAAAATGESLYADAADRLAAFLCRIQIRSERHAELDGGWFRAFDYDRWDYWASSGDHGWGAWSIESGWTQSWVTAVLAMRGLDTCLWDLTAGSRIGKPLGAYAAEMLPE